MKNLHSNSVLWHKLNNRTFKGLFNEFSTLFNLCQGLIVKSNPSLYLRVYDLLIYALWDLITYCGFNYVCAIYGEDFTDVEKLHYIPQYKIIFDPVLGVYLTFEEWRKFLKEFVPMSDCNIPDISIVDLQVCIDSFLELPPPSEEF